MRSFEYLLMVLYTDEEMNQLKLWANPQCDAFEYVQYDMRQHKIVRPNQETWS
jgi:hypothetical protein